MVTKTGNWSGARAVVDAKKFAVNIQKEFSKALITNGEILRSALVNGIRKGEYSFIALSSITVTIKRSRRILADRGDLTSSMNVKLVNPRAVFVGVPRGTKKRGKDMVEVARIMHDGSFKGVDLSTSKGKTAFRAMAAKVRRSDPGYPLGVRSGKKPGFIYTPPRPVFPPAWKKASPYFSITNANAGRQVWRSQLKGHQGA